MRSQYTTKKSFRLGIRSNQTETHKRINATKYIINLHNKHLTKEEKKKKKKELPQNNIG